MTVPANTSARMKRVRRSGTAPELEVRRFLTTLKVRYRLNNRSLPGTPDIANRSRRWAVFVHGCFWHAHRLCRRAAIPQSNQKFWAMKRERNAQRDHAAVHNLRRAGYVVLVVWECHVRELKHLMKEVHSFLSHYRRPLGGAVCETIRDGRTGRIALRRRGHAST